MSVTWHFHFLGGPLDGLKRPVALFEGLDALHGFYPTYHDGRLFEYRIVEHVGFRAANLEYHREIAR